MRPRFYLNASQYPEIKKWEVGKVYEVKIILKQKGKREVGEGEYKNIEGEFEVMALKKGKSVDPADLSKEEFKDMKVRALETRSLY
jgi:hypothetical protein